MRFTLHGIPREVDAGLTFRFDGERVTEVWDIPVPDDALAAELEAALVKHKSSASAASS